MSLKDFFDYYFEAVDAEVLRLYQELLPTDGELSLAYEEMFSRNDEEAIAFLLKFYQTTSDLVRDNPRQAILFNVNDNICFPFFLRYIWSVMDNEQKDKVYVKTGSRELEEVNRFLLEERSLRNWFRKEIGWSLKQEDLFALNEVIALQNFSSGGEYSFLNYVYPYVQKAEGRVLDAGCGAGFATLVMSQYLDVCSIDACDVRLERAQALSNMMKKGEKQTFPQVIKLIEKEIGSMDIDCEFPTAEKLLEGKSRTVSFTHGSIDNLPYEDNFFDMVNCLDVLEHTYDPAAIIKQFSRVVKPGGKVFITVPTKYGEVEQQMHESIDGTIFPAMLHLHHFDRDAISGLFAENGFREEKIVPFEYKSWNEFMEVADRSPARELVAKLTAFPFREVALQIFAVFEKE